MAVPSVGRPWIRTKDNKGVSSRVWRVTIGNSYPVADFQAPTAVVYKPYWGILATTTQSLQGMS